MVKQKQRGKGRQDKYYHLAKETGYRARSAFKLIQLNKKFGFLDKSRVVVDLCAAPGGWLQVAAQHMPSSSIIIGIDLCAIRPIRGVQTFQEDITTESCRTKLRNELHSWTVDCFLNDGAPNVGMNWLQDAYTQSVLTLHALKLACTFLRKGGVFVTKVFRSKDYQSLLWVFNQLFKKVHSTKPSASRNVSAEIFVVCQEYKYDNIKKIDKKFFDPRSVFEEVEERQKAVTVMDFEPKKRKAKGYEEEFKGTLVYQKSTVDEFLQCNTPLMFLKKATTIVLNSDDQVKEYGMDIDLVESLKDTKLLGKREVKLIAKWHAKTRKKLGLDKEEEEDEEEKEEGSDDEELDSEAEVEKLAQKAEEEEDRERRRRQKEVRRAKMKIAKRKANTKHANVMVDTSELFDLQDVKSGKQLERVGQSNMEFAAAEDSDSDEEAESSDESDSDADCAAESEDEENPLLVREEGAAVDEKWFQDSAFDGIEDEDDDVTQAAKYYEKKMEDQKEKAEDEEDEEDEVQTASASAVGGSKNLKRSLDAFDDDSDSDDDDSNADNALLGKKKARKMTKLDPEALALGTAIVTSQKTKSQVIDGSFNRYMHDDEEGLPDWFVEDEKKRIVRTNVQPHLRKSLVQYYQDKHNRNINDRTIKKVVEAKFRKKYHHQKRIERTNKQANAISDSTEMSNKEKQVQLKALYKKSGLSKKKEHTTYVFARKGMGARVRRPANVSGKFKVVDKRMKKEIRAQKKKKGKK